MAFGVVPLAPDEPPLAGALAAIGADAPRLAACARRWSNAFQLRSAFAPGFVFVGASVTLDAAEAEAFGMASISVGGNGGAFPRAVTSCLGETADLLSQIERPGGAGADGAGVWRTGWIGEALSRALTRRPLATIAGEIATSGEPVHLPADLVLRRPAHARALEPVGALSSGCAAGPDRDAAALRAILELIERDAAALWWLGGKRPLAFAPDDAAASTATRILADWRQGVEARPTRLLDLTTELEIPCVAAVSTDPNGFGLACGVAARLDPTEAAKAALGELCQMELAAPLAAAKLAARGEAGITATDRRHLQRAAFAAGDCALLQPLAGEAPLLTPSVEATAGALAAHLLAFGIEVAVVDLTRAEIGVAVMRAVAPGLQPYSEEVRTPRLRLTRACCGDASRHTRGAPLM